MNTNGFALTSMTEREVSMNKLHSLAPKPFVMSKDEKPWYKQFGNKKHKR